MTLSYWLDPEVSLAAPLQQNIRCDVAVIGGGLTGASAALALAERGGVDVALVEAGRIGGAASGRNAGFILQGTAERYDRARNLMGPERARAIHAWSLENHDRMAAAVERYGIDCSYRRSGSLQLAGSEREEAELVESARLLNQDGFEAVLLEGEALPRVYRDAGFSVGVQLPRDGEIQPARFVRGLASAARDQGVRLFEGTRVSKLDAADHVTLTCEGGGIEAQAVLLCTNAWAGQLVPWFSQTVDPVRGQMLATAPVPRIFDLPVYADHGYDYWRQDEAGRIVLGGWRNLDPESERGYDDVVHDGIQARMDDFLHRFEALRDVAITHRWSGVMGFSQDGLPQIGAAPGVSGVLAAVGFTGHGFGFAFLAGEALAGMVLDGTHPFAADLPARRLR